jgi:hypothetical protein
MPDLKSTLGRYVQEQIAQPTPSFEAVAARAQRRSRRRAAGASFTVVATLAVGASLVFSHTPTDEPSQDATGTTSSRDGSSGLTTTPTGPLPDTGVTSCAEEYTLATLGRRDFAFDGTVVNIATEEGGLGAATVTFRVERWFLGGSQVEVAMSMSAPRGGSTVQPGGTHDSEYEPSYRIGSRLLVSGEPRWGGAPLDDPVVWTCGFTRYYDPGTAADWNKTFN